MPAQILTADKMLTIEQLAAMEADHGRIGHGVMQMSHELSWQLYPLDPGGEGDDPEAPQRFKRAFFEIVVRQPSAAEVKIYKQRMKTAASASADDELLKQVCVYPSPEVLATLMDAKRGWALLAAGASKAILRLGGAAIDEEGKG